MSNKKDIEEDIKKLKEEISRVHKINHLTATFVPIEILENILADREKYKRLAEQNLKDSEEFKNNMCEHRCVKNIEIVELQSKANKYDSLIKEIEDKIEKLKHEPLKINENNKFYYETDAYNKIVTQVLQELLYKQKEKI